jgi:hypothetical protein
LLAQFAEAPEISSQIHGGRASRQSDVEMNHQFTVTGEDDTPVSHGRNVPLAFTGEKFELRYGDLRLRSELVAH